MKPGAIGVIQEGKFKGKRFIIPSEVWIEDGIFLNGSPKFSRGLSQTRIIEYS